MGDGKVLYRDLWSFELIYQDDVVYIRDLFALLHSNNKREEAYCEPRRDAKNFGSHSDITSNTHVSFKYDYLYAFRYTECDNIAEMAIL